MKKVCMSLLLFVAIASCKKAEQPAPPPVTETHATAAATTTTAAAPAATATLPAGSPIPASGVALWLVADDIKPAGGDKVASWSNAAIPGVSATADKPEEQPVVVANALNGHAVVRFDGEHNMLKTTVDMSSARMPEATVIAVFNSATDATDTLRKLYGDDDGGFDRAAGLDNRAGQHNYTVFTGHGVEGYFTIKPNESHITVDQFTKSDFSGWVDGKAVLTKVAAAWAEALPNLYIGGTGTSFHEPWHGDVAEVIVYARALTDQERMQVEDYLAKKYGVTVAR